MKFWERFSWKSLSENLQDRFGRLFISPLGQQNLEPVQVIHNAVDTVRQLYDGMPRGSAEGRIEEAYSSGYDNIINFAGYRWKLSSGGKSGYRYRFQNSEFGLIVFFGSRYQAMSTYGSHLKFEVSPHLVDQLSPADLQRTMDKIAGWFVMDPAPKAVALHLCVDVQGWTAPTDFINRMITWAGFKLNYNGVSEINLPGKAITYGEGETYLLGSASGLQLAVYRKDVEADYREKRGFWDAVWNRKLTDDLVTPVYDPTQPVWRIEIRLHHRVVVELLGNVDPRSAKSFQDIQPHLTGLWRTVLERNFRLVCPANRKYFDPFWQLLIQDVEFYNPDSGLYYKRLYKQPGEGGTKNLILALGNLLSVYARNRFTAKQALNALRYAGIWKELVLYYKRSGKSEGDLCQFVEKSLLLRRMRGIALA